MTGKALLIVHQETSDPGRVGAWLTGAGYALDIRRPALGDLLPQDMHQHDLAVIFGGPMSANDDHLPFIRTEIDWIPVCLASGKPFLGICLGAQMLSRALGGTVGPHPAGWHEIGYYRLEPTEPGRPLFDPGMHAYQWHGEGFSLPKGSELLASSANFEHQAFRYGNAYGIQFHPEITRRMIELWTMKAAHRLTLPGAQARDRQAAGWAAHDAGMGRWLDRFMQRLLGGPKAAQQAAE